MDNDLPPSANQPRYSPLAIDQSEMRSINRSAILEYLRLAREASRTEIAEQLRLSLPSVSRIVEGLIEAGLVRQMGKKQDSAGLGRGRELLELNVEQNLVVGIDLGGSHICGGLVNLGGEVLREYEDSAPSDKPHENYRKVADFLKAILSDATKEPARVLGVGIGVPGILDRKTGTVVLSPAMSWNNFPLLEKLEKITFLPILIENDVNLAALGEHWFGAGQSARDMMMIAIGTGIGAGIILNGALYRGFTEAAGEIGYLVPGIEYLERQYPGFGALESVASGTGIAERALGHLSRLPGGRSAPPPEAADVFASASAGQAWAQQTVKETIDYLSLAIANIVSCLDPELVILGGGVAGSADMLIPPIIERLQGIIPRVPRIEKSLLGDKAAILGTVEQVFKKHTGYHSVFRS